MGCLILIFAVLCFFVFPPLGFLLFLIGIVVMLMGIAGNTNRSIGVQQKIAAAHTPQAILKSEILRCTDPAAQTVLEEKLRTLEQQARTERAIRTKVLLIALGVFLAFFLIVSLFSSHSNSPSYVAPTHIESTPDPTLSTPIAQSSPYMKSGQHIDAQEPTVDPTPASTMSAMGTGQSLNASSAKDAKTSEPVPAPPVTNVVSAITKNQWSASSLIVSGTLTNSSAIAVRITSIDAIGFDEDQKMVTKGSDYTVVHNDLPPGQIVDFTVTLQDDTKKVRFVKLQPSWSP